MNSELYGATCYFVTVYIRVVDIVWKCGCKIVNGSPTSLLCRCVCVCHILCHRTALLQDSSEMCAHAQLKDECVFVPMSV